MLLEFASPIRRAPQHLGYVVHDLERAIEQLHRAAGLGPFFVMKDITHDSVHSRGEPAVFTHTAAFVQWGALPVELMQIIQTEPERVRPGFSQRPPQLHHVSWAVAEDELPQVRRQLEDVGFPESLHITAAGFDFTFHDGTAVLGHHIELHLDSQPLRDFFAMIRDATASWEGSELVRVLG